MKANTPEATLAESKSPSYKKKPRPSLEPTAIRQLVNLLGTEGAVARELGTSPSTVNDALRRNSITQAYELAARHILSKHHKHTEGLQHLLIQVHPEHSTTLEAVARGLGAKCLNLTKLKDQG